MPVEHAFLDDDHTQSIGRTVDDAGAHAAAGALAASNNRIDAEKSEMSDQRCAPKCARRDLLEHGFAGNGFNLIDDIVTAAKTIELFRAHGRAFFVVPPESPRFNSDAVHAGDVNNG